MINDMFACWLVKTGKICHCLYSASCYSCLDCLVVETIRAATMLYNNITPFNYLHQPQPLCNSLYSFWWYGTEKVLQVTHLSGCLSVRCNFVTMQKQHQI